MSKTNGRTPPSKSRKFVALHISMMDTPAWQSLDCVARAIYIELARRYRGPGTNNGDIPYAASDAAKALHLGKTTAFRGIVRLEDHGFIVATQQGTNFNEHGRRATRWRITEFDCDVTGELATNDFMRWTPSPSSPRPRPRPSLRARYI
jgi:hypothetical protein